MTERLYYEDSYLTEFEATVAELDDGGRLLYLDRSAFYPTSGGQAHDLGSIRGLNTQAAEVQVVDVVDEGARVAHVLERALPSATPGTRVLGRIDFRRRFDHMQQHTGQHLLSALFQELLGLGTLSVHFGVESSTLDLDAASIDAEQIRQVEERANARVFDNQPVRAEVEAADTAQGLRKASARSGPLRVVSIGAIDRSACGGTHVRSTGEIGPILMRKQERVRKATRVEFVCGSRAARRARADYDALARLGSVLSTSVDSVCEVVAARHAEHKQQTAALREARESLEAYRAKELYALASADVAHSNGLVVCVERRPGGALQDVRGVALSYIEQTKAVFIALSEHPPSLLLAASEDSGVDAGSVLKAALAVTNGRGGGSARLAQGSVEGRADLLQVLDSIQGSLGLACLPVPA